MDSWGGGSLGDRVTAARDRAFVGRTAERALFRSALAGEPGASPVLYLHGPGGIGKSALLRRFAAEAERSGRLVVTLDGRAGLTPEDFALAAGKASGEPGSVLLIDTFERCQGLEGWLWEQFLPGLPLNSLAVVAGRAAPDPRWVADPGWVDLLGVVTLRNLAPEDSVAFLRARGVPPGAHPALLAFTGGHPLALALAATVALRQDGRRTPGVPHPPPGSEASRDPRRDTPQDTRRDTPQDMSGDTPQDVSGDMDRDLGSALRRNLDQDVVAALLPQLVSELPSPEHRMALEVCAHAHVTSEALLRGMLGGRAAELFAWLRTQPFVESSASGLFPHDVVREVLAADLRWRDPEGFAALHRRMHRYLLDRIRAAPAAQMVQTVGALLYLYRNHGLMTHAHAWHSEGLVRDLPFSSADRDRVVELVGETEGARSAAIAGFWLARQPEAFRVYRSTRTGDIVAASAWLRLGEPEGEDVDPVVAAAWAHARATEPPRPGEHLAVSRFHVHPPAYHRPSPVMDLIRWRSTGEIIRSDRLAQSFVVMRDDGFWDTHLTRIEMPPVGDGAAVGDEAYRLFAHDWRTRPVTSWLAERSDSLVAGATEAAAGAPRPEGKLVVLSRPEFDAAVGDALRALRWPEELAASPLLRSRTVVGSGGDLRDVLMRAVDSLVEERGGAKRHRALTATYVEAAPTQEAAARQLGLPLSTYRRHLTAAVQRVADILWRHELSGTPWGPPD